MSYVDLGAHFLQAKPTLLLFGLVVLDFTLIALFVSFFRRFFRLLLISVFIMFHDPWKIPLSQVLHELRIRNEVVVVLFGQPMIVVSKFLY